MPCGWIPRLNPHDMRSVTPAAHALWTHAATSADLVKLWVPDALNPGTGAWHYEVRSGRQRRLVLMTVDDPRDDELFAAAEAVMRELTAGERVE